MSPAAAELDVVAAREVELPVVEPPRHVQVHAADAVLVVGGSAVQSSGCGPRRSVPVRVGEVAARPRRWSSRGRSGGATDFEFSRRRADSQALAASTTIFARTVLARAPVAVSTYETPVAQALVVGQHLAGHGAGDDRELAGLEGGRQQHRGRGEVRVRRAAAPALAAVVAGGAAVERLREDRQPRRDAGDAQLVAGLLDQQLVGSAASAAAWKMPSGSFGRPSFVPKMPTSASSLS